MSALAELQAGEAGGAFATELQRTIRAVAIARNFPPPEGSSYWDVDAVGSVVSEFMSDAQTPRRLTDLALHCASDDALRRRLQGTVRNFLADLGRRTPIGRLVLRINDVLSAEPGFVRVAGRWAREPGPREAGTDDPRKLQRAIAGHEVVAPTWGHHAQRSAPVADRPTIVSLCGALLDAAQGALTTRSLARAIGARLCLGQAPLSLEANAFDGAVTGEPAEGADETASEALRRGRADEVIAELNDRERLAVAYPELTVRQLAPMLGVSPSQAHVIRTRAVGVLRTELLDDDDAERIALLVMDLGRKWAETVDSDAGSDVLVAR